MLHSLLLLEVTSAAIGCRTERPATPAEMIHMRPAIRLDWGCNRSRTGACRKTNFQSFQFVNGQIGDDEIIPDRDKGDEDQKAGPRHALGLLERKSGEQAGSGCRSRDGRPRKSTMRTEGDRFKAVTIPCPGLVSHEELHSLSSKKTHRRKRMDRPDTWQRYRASVVIAERDRSERSSAPPRSEERPR